MLLGSSLSSPLPPPCCSILLGCQCARPVFNSHTLPCKSRQVQFVELQGRKARKSCRFLNMNAFSFPCLSPPGAGELNNHLGAVQPQKLRAGDRGAPSPSAGGLGWCPLAVPWQQEQQGGVFQGGCVDTAPARTVGGRAHGKREGISCGMDISCLNSPSL